MWQAILGESAPTFWLPAGASTVSGSVDSLFNIILWICIFFFLLVSILLVLFVVMYRHRPGVERDTAPGHSMTLELTWTLIPSIIVVFLYYYGFQQYMNMTIEPPNSYEVTATGQMWQWSFTYPNGHIDPELHVPVNTPVRVVLQSNDVIHSLSLPAFRMKKDVVPGRYNRLWFEATDKGEYDIFCADYCGTNHSTMRSKVIVQDRADFDAWLKKAAEADNSGPPEARGKRLYATKGCSQCHSLDGTRIVGPSWKDMWGRVETMSDGRKIKVDHPYVVESIRVPLAKIVDTYPGVMPPFPPETMSDADIENIIAFMKSISVNTPPEDRVGATTRPTKASTTRATTLPTAGK